MHFESRLEFHAVEIPKLVFVFLTDFQESPQVASKPTVIRVLRLPPSRASPDCARQLLESQTLLSSPTSVQC